MAILVKAAFMRASGDDRQRMLRALDEAVTSARSTASNPYQETPLDSQLDGFFADPMILQMSSEIVQGCDEYFMCRVKTCMGFCPNFSWIREVCPDGSFGNHYRSIRSSWLCSWLLDGFAMFWILLALLLVLLSFFGSRGRKTGLERSRRGA